LNLLLHLGSGFFIYRILSRAETDPSRRVSFWTTLLFLIHPVQTETVTYISGRASGQMAFFYLFGLCLYIEGTDSNSTTRRLYVMGALLSLVLALGSKETAMTFPIALLLWDVIIRRLDLGTLRATIASRHLPFWLIVLAAGGWAWWHPRYAALAQFSLGVRSLTVNILSELHSGIYALLLLVAPWEQSFDHDLPLLHSWSEWPVPIDLAIFAGMAISAGLLVRRLPLLSFGLAWYWLQLGPMLLISRNDLLSERNLYLAWFGALLVCVVVLSLLVQAMTDLFQRPARLAAGAVVIVVVLGLCLATVQRNALYRDPLLLWSDAVEKAPHKARAHNNLGHTYAERGDWERAIEHFRLAAQLDPEYWVAQDNLRDAYLHQVGRR
jgi:tetratricopeptide (TPR) repeat protein